MKKINLIALKWKYSLVLIHLNDVSFVLLSILFKYAFMHFIWIYILFHLLIISTLFRSDCILFQLQSDSIPFKFWCAFQIEFTLKYKVHLICDWYLVLFLLNFIYFHLFFSIFDFITRWSFSWTWNMICG